MENRTYIAIDLKSFYASVECMERGLDPLSTNLVVADESRTEKTICLAVTPTLKAYGIPGRPRLFEVVQKVSEISKQRLSKAPGGRFAGSSFDDKELKLSPHLSLDYIIAPPRMAHYIDYSTRIYNIYLKHVAAEDIHVYSIDEVFIDATHYLDTYKLTGREFATRILLDVLGNTGITAAAGIGTNLYLAKIAMDIQAKRTPVDEHGVRIAELDEKSYKKELWSHRPLTDFWRIGKGYAKKLEQHGMYTMGDIARCSLGKPSDYYNEDLLYKLFGVNAELLIDHAWGYEPCTIEDIKAYKPETNSLCSGQVLTEPYTFDKARLVAREMTDLLVLDLVDKRLLTSQIVMTVGYDIENLTNAEIRKTYKGPITTDSYGRTVPKSARGTINLPKQTSSTKMITEAATELFDRIVDKNLLVRRITITFNRVVDEKTNQEKKVCEQLDLLAFYNSLQDGINVEKQEEKEKKIQQAILGIKKKYGKNAVVKGMNLEEGATAMDRNKQIGGHKA